MNVSGESHRRFSPLPLFLMHHERFLFTISANVEAFQLQMCQNVTKQISSLNIIIIIYFIILIVIIVMVPSNPLFGMFVRLHVFPFHWAVWLLSSVGFIASHGARATSFRWLWAPKHICEM